MKNKSQAIIQVLFFLFTSTLAATAAEPETGKIGEGCTIAVISGQATTDGRPLLWKNRDIRRRNNKVLRFTEKGMSIIGLVTTGKNESKQVWAGINQTGFAIMNSSSNVLPGKV